MLSFQRSVSLERGRDFNNIFKVYPSKNEIEKYRQKSSTKQKLLRGYRNGSSNSVRNNVNMSLSIELRQQVIWCRFPPQLFAVLLDPQLVQWRDLQWLNHSLEGLLQHRCQFNSFLSLIYSNKNNKILKCKQARSRETTTDVLARSSPACFL